MLKWAYSEYDMELQD
jgi:hypothetical protein